MRLQDYITIKKKAVKTIQHVQCRMLFFVTTKQYL